VKNPIKILLVIVVLAGVAFAIHHLPGFASVIRKIHGG
jgi:hypothetical protein